MDLYDIYKECGGVITTDSRNVPEGSLFIGLKGENFDGCDYAEMALGKGAKYAVVNYNPRWAGVQGVIQVLDTYKELVALAKRHRKETGVKIIGITGTNGKTTTKELTAACLARKFKTDYTKGNLNNAIGVPLTLLSLKPETEILVLEMGASHIGDILELCEIANPDCALITNVGRAHIEGFGSAEGIRKTKGELFHYVAEHSERPVLFVNAADAQIAKIVDEIPQSFVKRSYNASCATITPGERLVFTYEELQFSTQLSGAYNIHNALAAITVATYFGVGLYDIKRAIEDYNPTNKRSQIVPSEKGNTIILDAYNANPSSMEVSIANALSIAKAKKQPAVILLGNMLELGEVSYDEHISLINQTQEASMAYFVGPEFRKAAEDKGVAAQWFETSEELAKYIEQHPVENSVVLIKGSRGSAMEKTLGSVK